MTFDLSKHEKSDPKMVETPQVGVGESQQLKRNFGLICISKCSTLFLADANTAKYNGYWYGQRWPGVIISFIGPIAGALSLGEMASMYLTAGGQYHFVSMLAPKRANKLWSWISGWISVFGWQTVAASAPFLAGTLIQGLLVLTVENYVYERWHGTLLYWAILLVAVAINVLGSGILPLVKKLSMVFHVIGTRPIPSNAVFATTVFFLALLGLINIGSTTAFNAIVALAVFGLQLSYLMPISLHFARRLMKWEPLACSGPWYFKRRGPVINLIAIIFQSYTSISLVSPPYQPMTAINMNYASVVFGAVFIFSAVDWMFRGRKVYKGPAIDWLDDFQN